MNILFVSHSSELAGAERSLVELVREAEKRGHSGVVTVPASGPLSDELKTFRESFTTLIFPTRMWMGTRFWFPVSLIRFLQSVLDSRHLYQLLKRQSFNVIVSNSAVIPEPAIAARLSGTRSLLILRESVLSNPSLKTLLPRRVALQMLNAAFDQVVVISDFVGKQLGTKAVTIPPQVSAAFLAHSAVRRRTTRGPGSALQTVMVGTLSAEKGQLDAVKAVSLARSRGANIELRIYGTGSKGVVRRIEGEIRRRELSEFVSMEGRTDDSLGVFGSADLTLICSKNEAFGKTSAESVLVGTPVLGYASGATTEIIDQTLGILVEPRARSLAAALVLVDENRERLDSLAGAPQTERLRSNLSQSASRLLDEVEQTAG